MGKLERKEKKEPREKLEIPVPRVWVVSLVTTDQKVNLVSMVSVVYPVPLVSLAVLVSLVLPVKRVNVVLMVSTVLKVKREILVLVVTMVPKVLLVKKVLLVLQDHLVLPDLPEIPFQLFHHRIRKLETANVVKLRFNTSIMITILVLTALTRTQVDRNSEKFLLHLRA